MPRTSHIVVGFYLHMTKDSGCGDVAFWCTTHPTTTTRATPEDVALNARGQMRLSQGQQKDVDWVVCARCRRWFHLNPRYYRAVPAPADLALRERERAEGVRRGIALPPEQEDA